MKNVYRRPLIQSFSGLIYDHYIEICIISGRAQNRSFYSSVLEFVQHIQAKYSVTTQIISIAQHVHGNAKHTHTQSPPKILCVQALCSAQKHKSIACVFSVMDSNAGRASKQKQNINAAQFNFLFPALCWYARLNGLSH